MVDGLRLEKVEGEDVLRDRSQVTRARNEETEQVENASLEVSKDVRS